MWSGDCGVWDVERGVLRVGCRAWGVKGGVSSVECGMESVKCAAATHNAEGGCHRLPRLLCETRCDQIEDGCDQMPD